MNAQEELVRRLATKRKRELGGLSKQAFVELTLVVRENPQAFINDDEEQAFAQFVQALDSFNKERSSEDLLDDAEFETLRTQHLRAFNTACTLLVDEYPNCYDAHLALALTQDFGPDVLLDELLSLEKESSVLLPQRNHEIPDLWDDIFVRPYLRVLSAISRCCMDGAKYRMALDACTKLMDLAPSDALGARLTAALAYVRLEDEDGFNALEKRFSHVGNAWFNLARVILMYKLGRLNAADRALKGFDQLAEGGACALMRPIFVDTYIPDRPRFEPGSFEETVLAVHEAESILADIPDFSSWAYSHSWFAESADSYGFSHGIE